VINKTVNASITKFGSTKRVIYKPTYTLNGLHALYLGTCGKSTSYIIYHCETF